MVTAATTPPARHTPAHMRDARPNPAENRAGSRYAVPPSPATAGRTATAMVLLAAEAIPEWPMRANIARPIAVMAGAQ